MTASWRRTSRCAEHGRPEGLRYEYEGGPARSALQKRASVAKPPDLVRPALHADPRADSRGFRQRLARDVYGHRVLADVQGTFTGRSGAAPSSSASAEA